MPSFIIDLPRKLLRITSGGKLISEIDGLRFVAILSVIIYHLNGYLLRETTNPDAAAHIEDAFLYNYFSAGRVGVQLFFVISGFILILPFIERARKGESILYLKTYYVRRFARIMPPYLINLVILSLLIVVVKHVEITQLLPHFLASLSYIHMLSYGEPSTINYLAWSLEIEIQFYIIAPYLGFVFLISNHWIRRGLLILFGLLFLGIARLLPPSPFIHGTFLGQAQYFLTGILLADIYASSSGVTIKCKTYDLAGIMAWFMIFALPLLLDGKQTSPSLLRNLYPGSLPLAIFAAYLCVFRGVFLSKLFSNRWLVSIGGMCYTIYLYHYALLSAVGSVVSKFVVMHNYTLLFVVHGAISIFIVIAICSLLFVVFEKPFMVRDWQGKWRAVAIQRLRSIFVFDQ